MAPPELTPNNGSPAGYGRSCTNCSRSKTKCILRLGGSICERCHRLNKECHPMAPTRKRTGKRGTSSRTTQLEEKIDDLVSILRASQPQHPALQQDASIYSPAQPSCTSRLDSLATAATTSSPQTRPCLGDLSRLRPEGALISGMYSTDRLPEPTPDEAEEYLLKFRGWLKQFPFVYIPTHQTAEQLRRERPVLWKCIMGITSMSVLQLQSLYRDIRDDLMQRFVNNHERNLDALLGLICYLGWATMNSGPTKKPFLIIFSQTAIAIAYELGLTKSPLEEQCFNQCFKVWGPRPQPLKTRTMDERRAILALWYLTSVIMTFLGKIDTLRWTPHMSECLEVLSREKEQPLDDVLVALVRLQHIGDEAHELLIRDVMGDPSQAPTHIFKKSLDDRMRAVSSGLPSSLASNHAVQSRIHALDFTIQSISLFTQTTPEKQRIDGMYKSLKAIRAWYDLFFGLPLAEFPSLTFSSYVEMTQTHVALYRLTTSEDSAWDKEYLRSTANLLVLFDQTVERLLQVNAVYQFRAEDEDTVFYVKAAKIMRNIKTSWEPVLSQHLAGGLPTPNSQATPAQGANALMQQQVNPMMDPSNVFPDPSQMDFSDFTWMTDVLGAWEA